MESKVREDLRLIKIARELEKMQIFDNKTASLLLFEAVQHIRKDKPFLS